MPWFIGLALLVVPVVEIAVIIQVGQVIGGWPTVALLVAESALGAWLVKREGRRAWNALRSATETGRMPGRELADAALLLVGGTLLLTPGFVTDVVGFFFILPFTRPLARRALSAFLGRRLLSPLAGHPAAGFMPGPFGPPGGDQARRPGDARPPKGGPSPSGWGSAPAGGTVRPGGPDVVQGEVVDPDDRPTR